MATLTHTMVVGQTRPSAIPTDSPEPIHLGMPQLSPVGLSEGWLLRECGARHWEAIAEDLRVPSERLVDARGNRLYSSFVAVRVTGSPLSAFREGDTARLHTRLTSLARNRFHSAHRLRALGSDLTVEMISALVRRGRARDNTSLCEAAGIAERTDHAPAAAGLRSGLVACERDMRIRQRDARRGGEPANAIGDSRHVRRYRPSPLSDFNGAGLLYFATYHAIVDRAEWECLAGAQRPAWATAGRDTFFFGNLNPGDEVEAVFLDVQRTRDGIRHRARLFRVSDGRPMAEVFTIKRMAP